MSDNKRPKPVRHGHVVGLHGVLYTLGGICLAILVLTAFIGFGTSAEPLFYLVICLAVLFLFIGLPLLGKAFAQYRESIDPHRHEAVQDDPDVVNRGFGAWLKAELETWAGPMHGSHAASQVIVLPILLVIGFIVIIAIAGAFRPM